MPGHYTSLKAGNVLIIVLILAIFTLAVAAAIGNYYKTIPDAKPKEGPAANEGLKTYRNEKYSDFGFSVSYPADLTPSETKTDDGLEVSFSPNSSVFEDEITRNIFISVSRQTVDLDLLVSNEKAKTVGHVTSKINHEEVIVLDGRKAIRIEFDLINGGWRSNVFVKGDGLLYTISAEKKLMDQILPSFEIIGKKSMENAALRLNRVQTIQAALEQHYMEKDFYPDSLDKLTPDYLIATGRDSEFYSQVEYKVLEFGKNYQLCTVFEVDYSIVKKGQNCFNQPK
jgi:hypothetical protein